jgi:adenylosuccinate lyase
LSGSEACAHIDLSGQTYPRVVDTFILADLASTASVLHKIATDIRLLCNRKEIDEPFEDKQIGSSARCPTSATRCAASASAASRASS